MKKALYITLITIGIIVGCDLLIGAVSRKLVMAAPDAGLNQTNTAQALFNKKADVLVLGSSRANHHYVSSMFKDSLGLTCYNAGRDGHDILYATMVLRSFLERCTPKLVITDLNSSMMDGSWIKSNKDMSCFYGASKAVTEILDKDVLKGFDHLKMMSNLYRYNNTLEWIATAYLSNWGEGDGYFPMPVTNNGMKKVIGKDYVFKPHPKCLEYLDDIVKACHEKNINIILCVSPSLSYSMHGLNDWMKEYGDKNRVQTFDFTGDTTYVDHPQLFFDATHLNDKEEKIFTKDFVSRLK